MGRSITPRTLTRFLIFLSLAPSKGTLGIARPKMAKYTAALILPADVDFCSPTATRSNSNIPLRHVKCRSGRFATLEKVEPVIHLAALDVAQRLHIFSDGHWIQLALYRTTCRNQSEAVKATLRAIDEAKVDVMLGHSCDYAMGEVARISSFYKIPVVTPAGTSADFRNKYDYGTLIRIYSPDADDIASMFVAVMQRMKWKKLIMLYHRDFDYSDSSNSVLCRMYGGSFVKSMKKAANTFGIQHIADESPDGLSTLMREEVGTTFSVILLCASPDVIRNIMLAAHDLNMVQSGEYVFFNIDVSSGPQSERPWHRSNQSVENNNKARSAYRALKTITLKKSNTSEYRNFEERVRKIAHDKYHYQEKMGKPYELNSFISAFYDAVVLYALALNDTLQAGHSPDNGTEITRRMWGRTFAGITGNVTINPNGDRSSDYSLLDLNPDTNRFEPVVDYIGATKQLFPVGKWHWVGEGPPKDSPVCGYDHSLCPEEGIPLHIYVIIGFLAMTILFALTTFFVYRRYRLEAELSAMSWRIRWDELCGRQSTTQNLSIADGYINIPLWKRNTANHKCNDSLVSLSVGSAETIQLNDMKQVFATTTKYKGQLVAIKKLNLDKPKIELTRQMLMELKKMKDLSHDHITRFVGACIDAPHYLLVFEYCQKGSLQDIVENDQLKLDRMMIFSLMHDIVKGMDFIHSSDIRSHGNLKSSNCVVDSRFVLKVTDFGLHSLHALEDPLDEDEDSYAYWRRKLWTAPELLRKEKSDPRCGTQKGDVYSFGIILHEMTFRNGVFYIDNEDITPQDIVNRVKLHQQPPFRPSIDESKCEDIMISLMTRCWAESPAERPDFAVVRRQVRDLNRQYESSNIVDNLLKRMEQYAENLEMLVDERTRDYLEEKRKAEDLLYNMLPKPVATQLIRGDPVEAEAFESVTIYFSDIVGFTHLSSSSTPMEVVNLLNDLYTCFDSIIGHHDVYKVETIGDAYMLVSGLPVRNGNLHAKEIGCCSLDLLDAVHSFKIRHRPNEQLKLRIGLHTGFVCAGVVGLKMPRYCLFGDTVNTASRMESNGMPLKIHVSSATQKILQSFGCFELELRGEVEMKGKGTQITYWLIRELSEKERLAYPR